MNSLNKKFDVIALGELLIDMTSHGTTEQGNTLFEANPGGAPCNVLAMLNKLGHKVGFIGKVGDDIFGNKLKKELENLEIDTEKLILDKEYKTTLAFVETFADGDRDFSFFRNPGADMMLRKDEIDINYIKSAKAFHFGTLSMTHEGVREATKFAVTAAKENGALITFDPNIREPLWESLDVAKEQVKWALNQCDVLKISDNEILWLTGLNDYDSAVNWIRERYGIKLILVSMGKEGSRAYYKDDDKEFVVERKPFIQKNTVETTGAGDVFCACVIHSVLETGLDNFTEDGIMEMLTYANAAASIITTRHGALRVMPNTDEIESVIKA